MLKPSMSAPTTAPLIQKDTVKPVRVQSFIWVGGSGENAQNGSVKSSVGVL